MKQQLIQFSQPSHKFFSVTNSNNVCTEKFFNITVCNEKVTISLCCKQRSLSDLNLSPVQAEILPRNTALVRWNEIDIKEETLPRKNWLNAINFKVNLSLKFKIFLQWPEGKTCTKELYEPHIEDPGRTGGRRTLFTKFPNNDLFF